MIEKLNPSTINEPRKAWTENTDVMSEVQRFVGWAIYSRKQFVTNQIALHRKKENVNKEKLLGWMFEKDVLQEMATYYKDVKSDMDYMDEFYPL